MSVHNSFHFMHNRKWKQNYCDEAWFEIEIEIEKTAGYPAQKMMHYFERKSFHQIL